MGKEPRKPTANYEDITFYEYHINITGLENIDCHLKGNKTDIVLNQNGKTFKCYGCTVKDYSDNHYHLICERIEYYN